ncbi:hypothetical protein K439DRAFT_1626905 [Ramaria rubella]|nr:hypothetical protein K439DRAFT_1626905 [Ramaria rubella]
MDTDSNAITPTRSVKFQTNGGVPEYSTPTVQRWATSVLTARGQDQLLEMRDEIGRLMEGQTEEIIDEDDGDKDETVPCAIGGR